MKERPIIICTDLIPRVLDDSKTQTRRVDKLANKIAQSYERTWVHFNKQYNWWELKGRGYISGYIEPFVLKCPYGQVGDRLWCKETWAVHEYYNHRKPIDIPQGVTVECRALPELVRTDGDGHRKIREGERGKWRPSIFMPRWASRIDLEITAIRVERVQEITEIDVEWEGTPMAQPRPSGVSKDDFKHLWDSLNAKRGYPFSSNCWVWVIEFKRIHRQEMPNPE